MEAYSQLQERVGIKRVHIVKGNFRGPMRLRSRGNQDHFSAQLSHSGCRLYIHGMRVFERGLSSHQHDVMQLQILQNPLPFHVYNFSFMVHEIVHSQIVFQGIVDAIQPALLQSRKVQSGFAQSLAGYRSGVNAASTYGWRSLNDSDFLAKVGGLCAGFFSGRSASNHDQIE